MKNSLDTCCVFLSAAYLAIGSADARSIMKLDVGWEFSRDGRAFAPVTVPHDWAIAGPFNPKGDGNTGKLPWKGSGVYRRQLFLDESPKGRYFLDFDGVMARATVFVNGQPCGRGEYGYLGFRADATPYLMKGSNTVEVRCDTLALRSRWYPGGGMYREARLVRTPDVYLEDDSIRTDTSDVLTGMARLRVRGMVASRVADKVNDRICVQLTDAAGKKVAEGEAEVPLSAFGTGDFDLTLKVPSPKLWKMETNAALYSLKICLKGPDHEDAFVRRVGFREFRFDPDDGFVLNGRRVHLKGVNLHADLGPLGMAFDRDAMRRQLTIMRDMGANALRTSHNCPAPDVLDLCDEMGIFVWDECFDKWNETCGRGDVPLEEFVPRTLAAWVRRDRTHPCVFAWSIGNEITPGEATPPGQEHWAGAPSLGTSRERCARFRHVVRAEDNTRPVAIGSCFPDAALRGDYEPLDLSGWNYRGMYDAVKHRYPDKPLLYSESASALSEWGFYASSLPTNKTDFAADVFGVDSYDLNASAWSDVPDREFFRMERDRYCAGEFVWTGIDYLGEPTPYADSRSSYFGICDLCAMPKDRYYLYRSYWNKEAFTLHLVPRHWTFPDKAGKAIPVFVYTSAEEAELFLNGRSLGRRRKSPQAGNLDDYYSVLPRYRLMWKDVPYEKGEIKVVAYAADGNVLGSESHHTASDPVKVVLTPERCYGSFCVVHVSLADKDGTFVPNDSRRVSFAAEGCEILAVGNADPRGYDSFKETGSHPLRFGRAAVYLRLKADVARLIATAEGLAAAEVEIN